MCKHGYISYQHDNNNKCEVCIEAKMTKKPFSRVERNSQLLELVHFDICEINGMLTRGRKRYFITFIDDYSRFTYVYLLRTKDEAFGKFKEFKKIVENQKERQIKILRNDRGGKYFSKEFSIFYKENGIIHQMTIPYTPQHNGFAERKNMTLVDMVNAMLLNANLPNNLWGEALRTACHILI
jgi:transposase InsO family protein